MPKIAPWARYALVASIGGVAYLSCWLPSVSDCLAGTVMALLRGSDAGGEAGHLEHTIALVQNVLSIFLILALPVSFIQAMATLISGRRGSWAINNNQLACACFFLLASSDVDGCYVISDTLILIAWSAAITALAWFAESEARRRRGTG